MLTSHTLLWMVVGCLSYHSFKFCTHWGSCHNTWDKIQLIATFQYFPTKWFLFFCPWVTRHTRQVEPERFDKKRPLLQFAKTVGVTVARSVTIQYSGSQQGTYQDQDLRQMLPPVCFYRDGLRAFLLYFTIYYCERRDKFLKFMSLDELSSVAK